MQVYWPRLLGALVCMGVLAATVAAMPFVIEAINAAILPDGNTARTGLSLTQLIRYGPFGLAGIGLVYALSQYGQSRLSLGVALDVLRDIQRSMIDRFLALDLASQQAEMSGALATRFTSDAQVLRETLTRITNGVRDLLQLIALCATMLFYDAVLFATILGVYALVGWPLAVIGKALRQRARAAQDETGDFAARISETATGAIMVKTNSLEQGERTRLGQLLDRRTRRLKGAAFLRAMNEPLVFLIGTLAMGAVVTVIGLRIRADVLDAPAVAGFIVALLLLSQPARGLSTLAAVTQEGMAAFERMLMVIDKKPAITEAPNAPDLAVTAGAITLENIRFDYGDGRPALTDLSLDVAPGESLALVGESGSGKSTLLKLLPRLYDPQKGRIMIDGTDIRIVSLASLRRSIAYVTQEPVLFHDTVRNNLRYGRPDATDTDVLHACEKAAAAEFISALPNGLDTILGEGGHTLSGGQRQRLSIARAFLKDAPILLLDEPTSALDADSEAAIRTAIDSLKKGRTTIIVAHRLSTVRGVDRVVVMRDGAIAESGAPRDLLAADGVFAHLSALSV